MIHDLSVIFALIVLVFGIGYLILWIMEIALRLFDFAVKAFRK